MSFLVRKLDLLKFILIVFLAAAGVNAYAMSAIFTRSPEPSSQPIKLSDTGVVADFKFNVRKHYVYAYSMSFHYPKNDQSERTRVQKILGGHEIDKNGKPIEPGVSTPINLTIFKICKNGKEVEIYSKDFDPILTSWGDTSFEKNLDSHVMVPGIYRARITNRRASTELLGIPITFEMGMPAKINFDPAKESIKEESCQQ